MQTVYLGNTLINDFRLGNRIVDDVFTTPVALPPVRDGLEVYLTTYSPSSYTSGSLTWNDISGNGRNFSLSNARLLTSQSYNGLFLGLSGSVFSTATASFSNGLPWTFNTTGSFFYVFRQATDLKLEPGVAAALGSINNGTAVNNDFTSYQRHAYTGAGGLNPTASIYTLGQQYLQSTPFNKNLSDGAIHLVYAAWNSGGTTAQIIAIDKNAPGTFTQNVYSFTNTGSIRLSLGTNANLSQTDNSNAAFFEVAYYSRKLTQSELTSSINYFTSRYNIT